MEKEIKISFRGDMYSVLPRKVWQILYNIYSEAGCDLTNLDNLLIDYDNCKELFDNLKKEEEVVFIFGCSHRTYPTTWISENKFWDDKQSMIEFNWCDVMYEVKVNEDGATFTRYK